MATNWHQMTVNDLYGVLSAPQVDAINNTFTKAGVQTNRFNTVAAAIVAEVQNRIQRRGLQVSKTPLSVPPELVLHVCWLIVEQMQMGLTGFDWSPQQMSMVKRAHDILDQQIQKGDFPITIPNDPAAGPTADSGGGVSVVQSGRREYDYHKLRGL
jgi:hypothetical protein